MNMKLRELKKGRGGFTLIELLIVIGIIAILATTVVLVLNPTQLLREARDGKRVTELKTIKDGLSLAIVQIPPLDLGDTSKVYVSLPDDSSPTSTCPSHNLPSLTGSGKTYQCANSSQYQLTNGNGWIPVNFDQLPLKVLSKLPIDPVNSNSNNSGLYYTYSPGSFELNARLESNKYGPGGNKDKASADGGDTSLLFEAGDRLTNIPTQINDRIGVVPTVANANFESCTVVGNDPPGWTVSSAAATGCNNTGANVHNPPGWSVSVFSAYVYQTLNLKAGFNYSFSVWAKVSSNTNTLLVSSAAGGGTTYCTQATGAAPSFTLLTCNYIPSSDQTVYLNLITAAGVGTGYFDDVSVTVN